MNANVQGLKENLIQESNKLQLLLQQTHDEALLRNEVQINRWLQYRKEHEELISRLLTLRDSLTHEIMVPLGKRALMRGRLVHTNEVLVCLGDGWFAKRSANQAADICQRRIQNCDEILAQLNKEKELLSSRKSIPLEAQAFSEDQTQELIEPYDEEEERKWKERHRQKEREYHQKLAEIKRAQNITIETEEDLWKRLDALDEQEEIEDEINRLDGEYDTEDSEYVSSHEGSSESDQECNERLINSVTPVNKDVTITRRVSFKEGLSENNLESNKDTDSSDENIFRIEFRHSDNPPAQVSLEAGLEVTSPAHLYRDYLSNRLPKSILKPSPSLESYASVIVEPSPEAAEPSTEVVRPFLENHTKEVMVKDVVESKPSEVPIETTHRPVSRFKAARLASKR